MGKLKILYFHQHFSTPAGKTGTRSYEMAKAARRKGHEVLVVCGSFDASSTGLEGEFEKALGEDLSMGLRSWNSTCLIQMTKVFSSAR